MKLSFQVYKNISYCVCVCENSRKTSKKFHFIIKLYILLQCSIPCWWLLSALLTDFSHSLLFAASEEKKNTNSLKISWVWLRRYAFCLICYAVDSSFPLIIKVFMWKMNGGCWIQRTQTHHRNESGKNKWEWEKKTANQSEKWDPI